MSQINSLKTRKMLANAQEMKPKPTESPSRVFYNRDIPFNKVNAAIACIESTVRWNEEVIKSMWGDAAIMEMRHRERNLTGLASASYDGTIQVINNDVRSRFKENYEHAVEIDKLKKRRKTSETDIGNFVKAVEECPVRFWMNIPVIFRLDICNYHILKFL